VKRTSQPEQALARLRDGLDCQLALLDWEDCGLSAARALREALPDSVPLLLLAEFDAQGMEQALQLGRTDALTKPFFVSALRGKVEELWAKETRTSEPVPVLPNGLNGMHFLAAEDNDINAEILAELLSMEGADCEIVENGRLAVERFNAAPPDRYDMILMDVQMPVMDGYEATRRIRACGHPRAREIPIVAMTANAFAEDVRHALDAGMNGHLSKPIDMDAVRELLGRLREA